MFNTGRLCYSFAVWSFAHFYQVASFRS